MEILPSSPPLSRREKGSNPLSLRERGKGLMFPRLSQMKYLPTQRIEDKERRKSACSRGIFSVLGPTLAEDRQHARARHRTTFYRSAAHRHTCCPAPGAWGCRGGAPARAPCQSLERGPGAGWGSRTPSSI